MPSQVDQALRNGSAVIAAASRPKSVDAIRARGDQRRRRQVIGSAITVVAIVAGGSVAATQLTHSVRVGTPVPATSGHGQHSHRGARPTAHVVIVPNAVGLAVPAAVSLLSAAGFSVTAEMSTCSGTAVPAGTVCSSDPAAGARVQVGATVIIDVAVQRPSAP